MSEVENDPLRRWETRRGKKVWECGGRKCAPRDVMVRCNRSLHRIHFDGEKLAFPDHPEMSREVMLSKFGSPCRCLEVLQAWRRQDRYLLPDGLHEPFDAYYMARKWSRKHRNKSFNSSQAKKFGKHRLLSGLTLRRKKASELVANELRASYLGGDYLHGSLVTVELRVEHEPDVWAEKREHKTFVRVRAGYSWHNRVFTKGLAVVGGVMVLAVLDRTLVEAWLVKKARIESVGGDASLARPWWVSAFGDAPPPRPGVTYALAVKKGRGQGVFPWPAELKEVPGGGRVLEFYQKPRTRKK